MGVVAQRGHAVGRKLVQQEEPGGIDVEPVQV